jgi:serine/threonine protein kinase
MAPEQFKKLPYDPFKAEIYSLGMLIFHMYFRAFPFETNAGNDISA